MLALVHTRRPQAAPQAALCTARPVASTERPKAAPVPSRLNSRRSAVCQARFFRDGTLIKTSEWRRSKTVAIRKYRNEDDDGLGSVVILDRGEHSVSFERYGLDGEVLSATTAIVRCADGWDVYTTVEGVLSTDTVSAGGRAAALLELIHKHGYVGRAMRI